MKTRTTRRALFGYVGFVVTIAAGCGSGASVPSDGGQTLGPLDSGYVVGAIDSRTASSVDRPVDQGAGAVDADSISVADNDGGATFGMSCTTTSDCPSGSTCCGGANETCDGTRLPSGDGSNDGEFIVNQDGLTVTDTITGLVWQRDGGGKRTGCFGGPDGNWGPDSAVTCSLPEAKAYCAALTLGGVSGWRLPTKMELMTILDLTVATPAQPKINQTAFPNTPRERFLTSSPSIHSGDAFTVEFDSGWSYLSVGKYSYARTRCVARLEPRCMPSNRFVALSEGLVRDTLTNLVWQQKESRVALPLWSAQAYCSKSGTGFRLPTLKELFSIVDTTVTSGPVINRTVFPNTPPRPFWTSSQHSDTSGDFALYVDFDDGTVESMDVGWEYYARCVR